MVENDFIDHAHHNNRAAGALLETIVFDEAVEMAMTMVKVRARMTVQNDSVG